jgi:hypothetical protein
VVCGPNVRAKNLLRNAGSVLRGVTSKTPRSKYPNVLWKSDKERLGLLGGTYCMLGQGVTGGNASGVAAPGRRVKRIENWSAKTSLLKEGFDSQLLTHFKFMSQI